MNNTKKWEQNVRRVVPYTPGEQPKESNIIKLNTNENPFPPSPMVTKALNEFNSEKLRIYPDTNSEVLVKALAKRYNVKPSQVFVGVGSDDVLSMAFLAFFNSDKPLLFPDVTYSFYDVWAEVYGIPYKTVRLDDNFRISPDDYKCENGGVIFPNPNAPTGILESLETVEEIVSSNSDSVVIVDEAYIDFGGKSCIELTEKYDNLLVVQTFSKSRSMAGMRIGFAIGSEKLIKYLNDVKFSVNSYTMNPVSQICGAAAVEDEEYFVKTVNEIVKVREYSKKRLSELGFTFTDSKSNFIFARHSKKSAEEIFNILKAEKIYVRYWNKPRISEYLRITIGTAEQMDRMFEVLEKVL